MCRGVIKSRKQVLLHGIATSLTVEQQLLASRGCGGSGLIFAVGVSAEKEMLPT